MIRFQSLPRQKRQAIRREVLRMYAETDMSYGEIAEVIGFNGAQLRILFVTSRQNYPKYWLCERKRQTSAAKITMH